MDIVFKVYKALKKRLTSEIEGLDIGWYNKQEYKNGNFKSGRFSAWIGFGDVRTHGLQHRIQQCEIPFDVLLIMPSTSADDEKVIERFSDKSTEIYQVLEGFSQKYAYLEGKVSENLKNQQLLTSVHRSGIKPVHGWEQILAVKQSFFTVALDFSACKTYQKREVTPQVTGNFT